MRSFRLLVVVLLAALVLTGCFQPAGEGIQATPIGQGQVEPPTPTVPLPTAVIPTAVIPTAEGEAQPLAQATLPPSVLNTAVPADGQGGLLPQSTPVVEISGAAMTATAMIAQAQSLQGQVTQAPTAAQFVQQPTQPPAVLQVATATPLLAPQLQGGEMTATAMVLGATATGFWRETATATALGVLPPTVTGTPTILAPVAPVLPPGSDCVHVVRRGENTYRIALRYGVTIADIARANGLANATLISIGQELTIPGCGNLTPTPGVPAGDATSGGLGESGGAGGVCGTHLIQPGENLYRIALRYGVTMNALRNANSVSNINVIKAGDEMVIPCP